MHKAFAFGPRQLAALLAALVLLVFWAWGARSKDCYQLTTTTTEYTEAYLADPAASGLVCAGFDAMQLYPGTYQVTLTADSTSDTNYFEVVEPASGTVLASAPLVPGTPDTAVTLTLTDRTERLRVRVYQAEGTVSLVRCSYASLGPVYKDAFWGAVLLAALAAGGLWLWRRARAGQRGPLAVYLTVLLLSAPFVSDHLPAGHDLYFHLSRISGLAAGLLHGQFPVRLNETFAYGGGYLSSVMYPELFFYLPGALAAAGASVLFACKVLYLTINLLTGWAAYTAASRLGGARVGLLFAVLYLANPYRLCDIFVRAALGEALAMAFLPLAAAGVYALVAGDRRQGFWMGVVGITGVFQSHMLSTVLVVLFGGGWALCHALRHARAFFGDGRRLATLAGAAAATLALNLWFLVPFARYAGRDFSIFHDGHTLDANTISLPAAFADGYGFTGTATAEAAGRLPVSIGLALLAGVMLFLWLAARGHLPARQARAGGKMLGMGLLALWLSTSLFPWAAVLRLPGAAALFNRFQFAWRFLAVAAVLLCGVTALALEALLARRAAVPVVLVAALAIGGAAVCCTGYLHSNDTLLETKSAGWEVSCADYLVYGSSWPVKQRLSAGGVTAEGAQVTAAQKTGLAMDISFTAAGSGEAVFSLPLLDTGLVTARLADGTPLALTCDENGLLYVTVPAGVTEGVIQVRYAVPWYFRAAEAASLLTALGLAAGALWQRQRANKDAAGRPDMRPADAGQGAEGSAAAAKAPQAAGGTAGLCACSASADGKQAADTGAVPPAPDGAAQAGAADALPAGAGQTPAAPPAAGDGPRICSTPADAEQTADAGADPSESAGAAGNAPAEKTPPTPTQEGDA